MVVHKGYVVREFGDCASPVPCHSVRKSFLSAIYGAWVGDDAGTQDALLTKSIAEIPLQETGGIPEAYRGTTLRQLFNSNSGIPLPAEYETKKAFQVRSKKPHALPGERWAYNNWDFNALGTAFNRLSGRDLFEVFEEEISIPVGMQDFQRKKHTAYFPAEGAKRKSLHPAYLFRMSARDRARLGLLYLAGGVWDSQRIIDQDWFTRSITDTVRAKDKKIDYGYMWWVGVNVQRQYPFPGDRTYSARGNGGQYIFVIPSRDLVVVHARDTTGGEREFDGSAFNEILHTIWNSQKGLLQSDPPSFIRRCEKLVPELMADLNVPGVAMAVVDDGKVVWSGEFGERNAKTGEPVTPQTRFEAASMTKPLYSYAVMKLVEEGKLDLDRPLVEYLDKPYMQSDDRHVRITARMVLSHRTGFPNWRKGGYSRKTEPPKLHFEPDEKQRYSGEGFAMLRVVVDGITGKTLDQFTRERLLEPMGMSHSRLVWDGDAEIAAAHNKDGSMRRDKPRYGAGNPAYTLFTTATDYAAFLVEMMKADRSAAHSISGKTRAEMLRSHSREGDKSNFALSWKIQPVRQGGFSHTGSNTGFRCGSWFDPETGRGLVVMTNSSGGDLLRDRIFAEALGTW